MNTLRLTIRANILLPRSRDLRIACSAFATEVSGLPVMNSFVTHQAPAGSLGHELCHGLYTDQFGEPLLTIEQKRRRQMLTRGGWIMPG